MKRNQLISYLERHGLPDDEIEISVEPPDGKNPIPYCTAGVTGLIFTSAPDGSDRCIHLLCEVKEDFRSLHPEPSGEPN
jgi:hypothetical protein